MKKQLGYGDYRILEQLLAGEVVIRSKEMNWTMQAAGLAINEKNRLFITDEGRKYLKRHKRPVFPESKP